LEICDRLKIQEASCEDYIKNSSWEKKEVGPAKRWWFGGLRQFHFQRACA
jgi:hypothetical protein